MNAIVDNELIYADPLRVKDALLLSACAHISAQISTKTYRNLGQKMMRLFECSSYGSSFTWRSIIIVLTGSHPWTSETAPHLSQITCPRSATPGILAVILDHVNWINRVGVGTRTSPKASSYKVIVYAPRHSFERPSWLRWWRNRQTMGLYRGRILLEVSLKTIVLPVREMLVFLLFWLFVCRSCCCCCWCCCSCCLLLVAVFAAVVK